MYYVRTIIPELAPNFPLLATIATTRAKLQTVHHGWHQDYDPSLDSDLFYFGLRFTTREEEHETP